MLYQKYRPATLEEMAGNEKIISALKAHFSANSHSHAHLLVGPRGCGKTTTARAIAQSILGADPTGIVEVNVGDERGIDNMREITKQASFRPFAGKARVFILDEAHGLTKDGKRALLKPTEDIPPFTYYFFCTTDPDALFKGDEGEALRSRLTVWRLQPLPFEEMDKLVRKVAASENIAITNELVKDIVVKSNGVPREALVLLEQAQGGSPDAINSGKNTEVIEFCRELFNSHRKPSNWTHLGKMLRQLKTQGIEAEAIRRTALAYASSTLMSKDSLACVDIIDIMSTPTYDCGFPMIVLQAYKICHCS